MDLGWREVEAIGDIGGEGAVFGVDGGKRGVEIFWCGAHEDAEGAGIDFAEPDGIVAGLGAGLLAIDLGLDGFVAAQVFAVDVVAAGTEDGHEDGDGDTGAVLAGRAVQKRGEVIGGQTLEDLADLGGTIDGDSGGGLLHEKLGVRGGFQLGHAVELGLGHGRSRGGLADGDGDEAGGGIAPLGGVGGAFGIGAKVDFILEVEVRESLTVRGGEAGEFAGAVEDALFDFVATLGGVAADVAEVSGSGEGGGLGVG